jgi:arylsulfatase A
VEVAGTHLAGTVDRAHDPEPIPSPDRVPRGEVYEKVWASLALGALELEKGPTRLVLRAVEIPARQACDIKAVQVRRVG